MELVKDPNIIKEFEKLEKQSSSNIDIKEENLVTDSKIIEQFNKQAEQQTITGKVMKGFGAVKDFFTGTKTTEYPDLPEIGEYKGIGAGKIAAGLLINPNQKAQAQIIQAQVPGSTIVKDKYDNIIAVMPDGKSFYLNKPGASQQDVLQTTAQILQYIPGYGYMAKKAGQSLLKRSLYTGIAGGATSVGQDIATKPLGAEEIDLGRAVISTVVPATFEGAINPIVAKGWKYIVGNPKMSKTITETVNGKKQTKIVLTSAGEKAAKAMGIDPKKMDQDWIKSFSQELQKGVEKEIAASQAGAGEFGFRLSKSQAKGDAEGIAVLWEASKGTYGADVQKTARDFLKQQGIDIEVSAKSLLEKFNKGEVAKEDLQTAGQNIINAVQKEFEKASNKVTTAYNAVDKDAVFNAQESNITLLPSSIQKSIKESTDIVDKELTPATIRATQYINQFVKNINNTKKQKVSVTTFNEFEMLRRKVQNLFAAAKNPTDKKNLTAILQEYDKFYDDAIENALFSGEQSAINAIKNARIANRVKQEKFGVNPIKKNGFNIEDRAGKVIQKILNDPDVTPLNAIDYIFGSAQLGSKNGSLTIVKRLKDIFGQESGETVSKFAQRSSDFQSLRTSAFEKIIRDSSRNGVFNPKQFNNIWNTARQKYDYVLKELYTVDEIKLIDRFVKEVDKTIKGKDLVNASNTASALSRAIQSIGRGLLGILGFKTANIQGLILARNAFDRARDLSSQKTAKKLIETELTSMGIIGASPRVTATGTVAADEFLNELRQPLNVPVAPRGAIR